MKIQKKFFSNIFNVESASAEDLQSDILAFLGEIEEQQKEIEHLKRVNLMAVHIMTDKQNDKLISILKNKAK